jgi:serine/threonine protein kinase
LWAGRPARSSDERRFADPFDVEWLVPQQEQITALSPGTRLGHYNVTAELGHGGMGVVYTAQDPRLKRQVAIKLLPPGLTRNDTAKQRFLQEAQAASALDHPNICTIHEINETDDDEHGGVHALWAATG